MGSNDGGKGSCVVPIAVAVIGAVATIVAALISNGTFDPGKWSIPPVVSGGSVSSSSSNPESGESVPPSGSNPAGENNPPPVQLGSVTGNWSDQVGDFQLTVTKVEAIKQVGSKRLLRFHITARNDTTDSITLPLFKNFSAVGNNGESHESNHQVSKWPEQFPPGAQVSGSVDLEDGVSADATTMTISFATIFGSLDIGGNSLTITDIPVP